MLEGSTYYTKKSKSEKNRKQMQTLQEDLLLKEVLTRNLKDAVDVHTNIKGLVGKDIRMNGRRSCETIGPSFMEFVWYSKSCACEVSNTQLLHIFQCHLLVFIDVQNLEE